MKKIGIIGYGWLGERIADSLSGKFFIYTTTTSHEKAEQLNAKGLNTIVASFPDYQLSDPISRWNVLDDIDILIITIPISGKRCCASSLYNRIQNLSAFIGDFQGQMFLMSSTGVYPDLSKDFTEEDIPVEQVSGERMMKNKYPQINILRLGGLMGDNRLLKNYNISNPDHVVNHIHYKDISGSILKMIEKGSSHKLYNITAPIHPVKSQVMNAQKNIEDPEEITTMKGKKILSSKLIKELEYVFQYPDPRKFHEIL